MGQCGDGAGFALEPLPCGRGAGGVAVQQLDGDGPLQPRVHSTEDLSHAAGADASFETVRTENSFHGFVRAYPDQPS
jgi:hypothetical protein